MATQEMKTFGEYAKRWLELYKAGCEPATKTMYRQQLNALKKIWDRPLESITREDLQLIINDNRSMPRKCQKVRLTMGQVFGCAVDEGLISCSPARKLSLPRKYIEEKRVLTDEEVCALQQADFTEQERTCVNLMYYFGLRPEEMRAVQAGSFDFRKNVLKISGAVTYDNSNTRIKCTKTGRTRQIPVPDKAAQYFGARAEQETGYLVGRDGEPLSREEYRRLYNSVMRKLSLQMGHEPEEGLTFYTFRHSYATFLYENGVRPGLITVKYAAWLCGNSPEVFMHYYAHIDRDREEEFCRKVLGNL